MIAISAALYHSLTLPPEPFYFLEMGMKHHEFEDEAPENWDGEDHDELKETDFASLITNHMNLVQKIPLEEAVHDTILPI